MIRKKITLDTNTYASNPGKISFKPLVWVRHDLANVLTYILPLLLSVFFSLFHSYFWLLIVLPLLLLNFYYWISIVEHYTADSNLGVVISVDPPLVAVYTDLTKGIGSYPAIKIIEYRTSRKISLGSEVATAATYRVYDEESFLNSDEHLEYWVNFYPLPLDYATDDETEIETALSSYPRGQKQLILATIRQISQPYRQGLYKVNIISSDWKTAH